MVILSLSTGTVVDYAVGAYKGKGTGEHSLLRCIFDSMNEGDILLGDRYFPSFFLLADLKMKGIDGIFKGQSQRQYDFRQGKRLAKNDHLVNWKRPRKPEWMDQETYNRYPTEITVREFKVNGNVYVTTFMDSKKCHKKELARIYLLRWQIEISLDSIKTVLGMDMLSCKTPEMVRKEIGIHFLAYNFIRILIAQACQKHECIPREVSFKGALQLIMTEAILATRLNGVVAAYRGHSRGELIVIGLVSLITALMTLSLLTRLLLGWWMLGVGLSFPVSVFIAWMLINVLERYKVGKPRGYLKCRFRCYLKDLGILASPYVRRSGTWSIRREWRND